MTDNKVFSLEGGDLLPFTSVTFACGSDPNQISMTVALSSSNSYVLKGDGVDPPQPMELPVTFHKVKDDIYVAAMAKAEEKEDLYLVAVTSFSFVIYNLNQGDERTQWLARIHNMEVDSNGQVTTDTPEGQRAFIMEVASDFPSDNPLFSCHPSTT